MLDKLMKLPVSRSFDTRESTVCRIQVTDDNYPETDGFMSFSDFLSSDRFLPFLERFGSLDVLIKLYKREPLLSCVSGFLDKDKMYKLSVTLHSSEKGAIIKRCQVFGTSIEAIMAYVESL